MQERIPHNVFKSSLENHFVSYGLNPHIVHALSLGYCSNKLVLRLFDDWFNHFFQLIAKHATAKEFDLVNLILKIQQPIYSHNQIDQSTILLKLAELSKKFDIASKDYIDLLKVSKGFCGGFSALVSYAFILEQQPLRFDQNNKSILRDDWTWLKDLLLLISSWNESKPLTTEDIIQIKRLLCLLEYYQFIFLKKSAKAQGDNHESIDDTCNRKLNCIYTIAVKTTQHETASILEKLIPNKINIEDKNANHSDFYVIVDSHNHETSIIYVNNKLYYYDPNNLTGPIETNIKDLAFLIFLANGFDQSQPSPIGMRFFSFSTNRYFPSQASLLKETSVVKQNKLREVDKNYCHGDSALDAASWIGCKASFDFYLSVGCELKFRRLPIRYDFITHLFRIKPDFEHKQIMGDKGIFHSAIETNNIDLVRAMLVRTPAIANMPTYRWNKFPLTIAIENELSDMIQLLLILGANPEALDTINLTPFYYALQTKNAEILRAFRYTGLLDKPNNNGNTPLGIAVLLEDFKLASALLAAGANPSKSFASSTPLHRAARYGNIELINLLLQWNASIYALDSEYKTPIDIAKNEITKQILLATEKKNLALREPQNLLKTSSALRVCQ